MLREALTGTAAFLAYYVAMAGFLFCLKRWFGLSGELFRKLFHIGVAASTFLLVHLFDTWHLAALAALSFGLLAYFVISWAESVPAIPRALEEREPGEIRSSLLLMFLTIAGLIALGWGWLEAESRYLVIAPMMALGLGDAGAALVGKKWGRNRLTHPAVDGLKTVEGTVAMLALAAVAVFATLAAYTPWPWFVSLAIALLVAPVSAATELVTRRGLDTVTVPLATFAWLLTVVSVLGWVGVV